MANDPSGKTRVDVIIQAKDADNAALRSLLKSGEAHVTDRIGNTETMVVNLPLSSLESLSKSGLINFISPDRPTTVTGHVEESIGADMIRSQAALNGRSAYTLDGSDIGVAVVDSGIASTHNGFKNGAGASRIVANVNFTSGTLTATTDGYGHDCTRRGTRLLATPHRVAVHIAVLPKTPRSLASRYEKSIRPRHFVLAPQWLELDPPKPSAVQHQGRES